MFIFLLLHVFLVSSPLLLPSIHFFLSSGLPISFINNIPLIQYLYMYDLLLHYNGAMLLLPFTDGCLV